MNYGQKEQLNWNLSRRLELVTNAQVYAENLGDTLRHISALDQKVRDFLIENSLNVPESFSPENFKQLTDGEISFQIETGTPKGGSFLAMMAPKRSNLEETAKEIHKEIFLTNQ
jgi:hypothetical protein